MTVYSLSPGFVKIFYTASNGQAHVMTLPVLPFAPDPNQDDNELILYSGDNALFTTCVDDFIDEIDAFYNTGTSFSVAELWSMPAEDSDPVFIQAYGIEATGAAATATQNYSQAVMTHRTSGGNISKLYLMNTILPPNTKDDFPFAGTAAPALDAYLRGTTAWIYGRDNTKKIAGKRLATKTNDNLRKRGLGI